MSKYYELIARYYRKGLYTTAHLAVLVDKGSLTPEERRAIEAGE